MTSSQDDFPSEGQGLNESSVFIHDLKNILTGALGHLSLARRRAEGNVPVIESLGAVENILQGASSLAEMALRPNERHVPQDLSVLDVVGTSIGICIPPEGFSLRLTYEDKLPLVRAEVVPLRQLFNNLFTNAVQSMPGGGSIRVHFEREGPNRRKDDATILRVTIEDDGPGISEEIASRIFEPGFSTRKKGSGIGLSSARKWLDRIGGEITLNSGEGGGTTFLVRLPGLEKIDPRSRLPRSLGHGAAGRALVLDDDPLVLQIVEEMLDYLGWEVSATVDGRETIRLFEESVKEGDPFSLVVLDLRVPGGLGGVETAVEIRKFETGAKLFISSGEDTAKVMNHPEEFGFTGRLKKPFSLEELSRATAEE
ncbi:MAG: hybrid sensor histidine kinase/response regulator [Verrucomicrobiota bacterium]